MATGIAGFIGFAPEASGGVAVPATAFMEMTSESFTESFDRYSPNNIVGRLSEPDDYAGIKRVAGNVVGAFHPGVTPRLLRHVFQAPTTTGSAGGLFNHVFRPRLNGRWDRRFPNQPLTFEINRDVGSSQQYRGGQIRTMELNTAPNQELRMSLGLIGMGGIDVAAATPTFPTTPGAPFKFDTLSLSLMGAAYAEAESFTWSIDNQISGIPTLNNSTDIQKYDRDGEIQLRWAMTVGFEDLVMLNAFRAQSEFAIKAVWTMPSSHQLIIDIPRAVMVGHPLGISGRGRQTVDMEGMCRYHTGSATATDITVRTHVQSC